MSGDAALKVGQAWWEAFCSGDLDAAGRQYHEDAYYVDYCVERDFRGRQEIVDFWKEFMAVIDLPTFKVETHSLAGGEEYFSLEWTLIFTVVKDWEIYPANPNEVTLRGGSIVRVENGLIADHRDYYNGITILNQQGVLKSAIGV